MVAPGRTPRGSLQRRKWQRINGFLLWSNGTLIYQRPYPGQSHRKGFGFYVCVSVFVLYFGVHFRRPASAGGIPLLILLMWLFLVRLRTVQSWLCCVYVHDILLLFQGLFVSIWALSVHLWREDFFFSFCFVHICGWVFPLLFYFANADAQQQTAPQGNLFQLINLRLGRHSGRVLDLSLKHELTNLMSFRTCSRTLPEFQWRTRWSLSVSM